MVCNYSYIEKISQKVEPVNLDRIITYLTQQGNILSIDKDKARDVLNDRTIYAKGSHFSRVFCEDEDGSPVQFAALEEVVPLTISNTSDPGNGYGPDFRKKRKILTVLQFRHGRGRDLEMSAGNAAVDIHDGHEMYDTHGTNDPHESQDHGPEHQTQIDMNTIRYWRKGWNQYLWRGLGRVANIYFHNTMYTYDEQWLRSLGGIRRVGFISDGKGNIVAKMQETQWYAKPLGNFNRRIDIFDKELAEDNSFARIMAMFGDFETHHKLYENNRLSQLQESGPKAHETNTAI